MIFLVVFLFSLFVATLLGHCIHWSLHRKWTGPAHRSHMEHHLVLYPPESLTSKAYKKAKWYHSGPFLFTPAFLIILGAAWGLTCLLGLPFWALLTFGATLASYGFFNDWAHDSFHVDGHVLERLSTWRRLRNLHFIHHVDMNKNFGIVNFAWDKVFKTFKGV